MMADETAWTVQTVKLDSLWARVVYRVPGLSQALHGVLEEGDVKEIAGLRQGNKRQVLVDCAEKRRNPNAMVARVVLRDKQNTQN